jgi:Flp pilus assembly protein TadG
MITMARLSRLATANGGASAIEFALVAAFLILPLTLGVYVFGTALWSWMEVGNAARAGAQYVNVNGYSSAYTTSGNSCATPPTNTFTCAVKSATRLGTNVTVSVANAYCGCQSGTTYTVETFSPPCNVCNANYTSNCCPASQTPVTLAQVNASYTYTPIFRYLGFGPSNGFNLTAQATALVY